jgi:uncharacterized protein (DUF427 family)
VGVRRDGTHIAAIALMGKSPGHQSHPGHKLLETFVGHKVRATVNGDTVAESNSVIRVDEAGHRARYYFPRDDVRFDMLERSATVTHCPYKGDASYFSIALGDRKLPDAVWSYEDPYEEHQGLRGRLAFYEEKFPELAIQIED